MLNSQFSTERYLRFLSTRMRIDQLLSFLHPEDMVPTVDVDHFSGNSTRHRTHEK